MQGRGITCLDLCIHRTTEQEVARIGEETNGGYTLCVASPCMDAGLGDKGLLGAGLGGEVGCVGEGRMHVGPALVVGHGLAMENGRLLSDTATFWLGLLFDDGGLGFVVLFWEVGFVVLFDAVEEGGLVFALPGSPRAEVSAVAVDDVEGALVFSFALEVPFLGVCGAHCVDGGKGILCSGVEGAEEGGSVWVDGGIE